MYCLKRFNAATYIKRTPKFQLLICFQPAYVGPLE